MFYEASQTSKTSHLLLVPLGNVGPHVLTRRPGLEQTWQDEQSVGDAATSSPAAAVVSRAAAADNGLAAAARCRLHHQGQTLADRQAEIHTQ